MMLHPVLQGLMELGESEASRLGVVHTPAEIASQPRLWRETVAMLSQSAADVRRYLSRNGIRRGGSTRVLLAGAGSSHHVAIAVEGALRRAWRVDVRAVPSTDLVTHAANAVIPGRPHLLVSFARSGDSPESLAAAEAVRRATGVVAHVVVTCNPDGKLAGSVDPERDLLLLLPPESNDRGLAMTASFTCLVLAGLWLAGTSRQCRFGDLVEDAAATAERLMTDGAGVIAEAARSGASRAVFLGSGPLRACARECALKLQELTDGSVVCHGESFLGLRHGPQAVIRDGALVVALLSSDPVAAPYEADLICDLRAKGQAGTLLAIGHAGSNAAMSDARWQVDTGPCVARLRDELVLPYAMVGQLLGLFASLALGLRPDNPSPLGVIHRVVKGVRIHETT